MDKTKLAHNREKTVYYLDVLSSGLSFGKIKAKPESDLDSNFVLALNTSQFSRTQVADTNKIDKQAVLFQVENELSKLSRKGVLRESEFYLGLSEDPLHPFEAKFDLSMKILDLFKTYVPGKLYIQTRSPLIVLTLPVLKKLGEHVAVRIAVETHVEEFVKRYTPNFPKAEERFKAALALKKFGVEVGFKINPLLPYGKWREDAHKFARILAYHADYTLISPLRDGSQSKDRIFKDSELVRKLILDRQYEYLHVNSCDPLLEIFEEDFPERLVIPEPVSIEEKQLSIFAA